MGAGDGIPRVVYSFESIDDDLTFMPLAVRRVLDLSGRKLSLGAWQSLPVDVRWKIARGGAEGQIAADAVEVVDRIEPRPERIEAVVEPSAETPPADLQRALGPDHALAPADWRALRPLDRYALVKSAGKPEKLARAYDEIVRHVVFTHLSPRGEARMVDVGTKPVTSRRAVASARVHTTPAVVESIASGTAAKGDVLAAARIAGILASKRTPEIVPLCHPVHTTHASIELTLDVARGEVGVTATVEAVDRTGVEMEALVAASVAALTAYVMIKGADRWASIEAVRLEAKSGGRSGDVSRPAGRGGGRGGGGPSPGGADR
jgi:cyclic pyranopterin phosphate synthase